MNSDKPKTAYMLKYKWNEHKDTCKMTLTDMSCAHEASKFIEFDAGNGKHFRIVNGMCVCACGRAVRAKELRDWVISQGWQKVQNCDSGKVLIYEEDNNQQGHVYVKVNGTPEGNGLYDWEDRTELKIRTFYRK